MSQRRMTISIVANSQQSEVWLL